jgi:hypothetical protein
MCAVLAAGLAACGGDDGNALGDTACSSVEASLRALQQSSHAANAAQRAALMHTAAGQLREAFHPAELAAQQSTDWQALAATLEEIQQNIPEKNLVTALSAQCAASPAAR